jgi:F-type H+-transporting ATPase subunit delta
VPGADRSLREQAERRFSSARADGSLGRVREELLSFARVLRDAPALRAALADVTIGPDAKRGVIDDLVGSRFHPDTVSVLHEAVSQGLPGRRLIAALQDLGIQAALVQAEAEGTLADVEDVLFRFGRLLAHRHELHLALTDPALASDRKFALLDDLLAGKAEPRAVELVKTLVDEDHSGDLRERLIDIANEAARRRNRVVVEARTAVELDQSQQERLAEALERATGKEIDLKVLVDSSIVGGVVARVGDDVFDGSVRRKLEMAFQRLTS